MENEIKRMNYFDGQFLKEREFQDEQYYHRHMRRRLNYLMFETSGTVQINPDDLTFINIDKNNKTFQVKSGMAVSLNIADREGKEIILREDSQVFNLNDKGIGTGQTAFVTVHYAEQLDKDPPSEGDIDENTRVREVPIIEVHSSLPTVPPTNNEMYIYLGSIPNDDDMEPSYIGRPFATLRTTLLNIELASPILELNTNRLSFTAALTGPNPPAQEIIINNIGGGSLSWSASLVGGSAGWLKIDPRTGTAPDTIAVSVDLSSLSDGNFTETIQIISPEAKNSPKEVEVELAVVAEPVLDPNPTAINFSAEAGAANPAPKKLKINNSGGGQLTWNVSLKGSSDWLKLNPVSGGAGDEITVSADISGLASGTFGEIIVIESTNAINSPIEVNVMLNVSSVPIIGVSPPLIKFSAVVGGSNPSPTKVQITNAGGGILKWKANFSDSQLVQRVKILPNQGTAPTEITVSVNISGLAKGSYSGILEIESDGTQNSPRLVPLSVSIKSRKPLPQLQPVQLQPVQLQPVQLQPVQLQPVQLQPVQLQPVQLQPVQLQPVQLQPVQRQPAQLQPLQLQPQFQPRFQPGPSVVNFEAFPLTAVKDVGSKTETRLTKAGFKSIPDLAKASPSELAQKTKMSEKQSSKIIRSAKKFVEDNLK